MLPALMIYLQERLTDSEFKTEWDALEEEFEVAKEIIHLRLKAGLTQKELAGRTEISVWLFFAESGLFWG